MAPPRRQDVKVRDKSNRPVYGKKGVFIDDEKYPLDPAKCGTESQATAHRRRGHDMKALRCDCLYAESRATKDRKERRKGKKQ